MYAFKGENKSLLQRIINSFIAIFLIIFLLALSSQTESFAKKFNKASPTRCRAPEDPHDPTGGPYLSIP